jgi:excisionase family DNA binding protein
MMARQRKDSNSPTGQLGEIMTTEDVARYLVCYYETVYRLIKESKFPAFKLGSDWRFRRSDIDTWIAEHEVKPEKGRPV